MTTGADVRDILELTGGENDGPISKKDLINSDKVRDDHNVSVMFIHVISPQLDSIQRVTQTVGLMPLPQQDIERIVLLFCACELSPKDK